MQKRFIVEIGMGADLHGQDVTKAGCRAVQDAISRSCLCGIVEILNLSDLNDMIVEITLATPLPDQVNHEVVLAEIPFGRTRMKVVEGGMTVPTLMVAHLGDTNANTVVALAAVTVWVEVES